MPVINEFIINRAKRLNKESDEYFAANPIPDGYAKCSRCHGWGIKPEYQHNQDGICFECGGKRIVPKKVNK